MRLTAFQAFQAVGTGATYTGPGKSRTRAEGAQNLFFLLCGDRLLFVALPSCGTLERFFFF